MMTDDAKKLIAEMKETPYRGALIQLLDEELTKMGDLMSYSGSMEERGAQVMARQEAAKIIKKIFAFLDYQPSKEKPRNQYL